MGEHIAPTAARDFAAGALLGVQAEVAGRPVQVGKVAVRIALLDADGDVVRTADGALDAGATPDRQRATGLLDTDGLGTGAYLLTVEAIPPDAADIVRHAIPVRLDASTSAAAGLHFSVVAHGPSSSHDASGTFVIRTEGEWRAFWSHLPTRQAAPPIDFDRVTLFAIIGGSGLEVGRPVVMSVDTDGGETVVSWRTEPGSPSVVIHPFTVVALPTLVTNPVRFEQR